MAYDVSLIAFRANKIYTLFFFFFHILGRLSSYCLIYTSRSIYDAAGRGELYTYNVLFHNQQLPLLLYVAQLMYHYIHIYPENKLYCTIKADHV